MQEFSIFSQTNIEQILLAALEWETTDQYFVWKLMEGEGVPVSDILPIIPHLAATSGDQFESLTQLILYLKSHSPEGPILKSLLTSLHESPGVQSLLLHWTHKEPETLARVLTSMVHIVASEDTDLDLIVLAVRHISSIQSKTDEFQAVLRDADLIKSLLNLFESNDILKDQFGSFFHLATTNEVFQTAPAQATYFYVERIDLSSKFPKFDWKWLASRPFVRKSP